MRSSAKSLARRPKDNSAADLHKRTAAGSGGRPRRSVIGLRTDFDAQTVRSFAEELMDRPQVRQRLLAVAAIFDGATRTEAAKIAGVTAQTVREWVVRFNVDGPDGLINF